MNPSFPTTAAPMQSTKGSDGLPLVSVIIPFYKQEAFLADTIASVKRLTYPFVETIVVDDESPVRASDVLAPDKDVLVLRTRNGGCAAARNFGFTHSSGEYLLFLDSDDLLAPDAIEKHLQSFSENPNAGLTFGAARIIDENGREVRGPHVCRPRRDYFKMFLEGNPIATPGAAMFRKSAFVAAGPFDESFRLVEDYRLYLKLARQYPIAHHDGYVIDYRTHSSSGSKNKESMFQSTMAALDCLEMECELSEPERRRIRHGRKRWAHVFHPEDTLSYRLASLYYKFCAMRGVRWN